MKEKKKRTYKEQREAIKKYQEKKSQISLTVDKEQKERWTESADKEGTSLTGYIVNAVEEYQQRD